MKKVMMMLVASLDLHFAFAQNFSATIPTPQNYNAPQYRGVNLAGYEFGEGEMPPTEYFPTTSDATYFIKNGMNTMRLPIEWTYLQPDLAGSIGNNAYEASVYNLIDTLTAQKVTVILDVHDYMRYGGFDWAPIIGEPGSPVSTEDFVKLWTHLSQKYANNPYVIFDLMNEPHANDDETYPTSTNIVTIYNQVIAAIRNTGAHNLILLEGNAYSGLHSWESSGNAAAFASPNIVDPDNNFAINLHQYFDGGTGYAGTGEDQCDNPNAFLKNIHANDLVVWLKQNHYKAMVTEFGGQAPNNDNDPNGYCNQDMTQLVGYMNQNSDVFIGWIAWAGGRAWSMYGDSNPLDLQGSKAGIMVPQLQALLQYLNPLP